MAIISLKKTLLDENISTSVLLQLISYAEEIPNQERDEMNELVSCSTIRKGITSTEIEKYSAFRVLDYQAVDASGS